MRNYIEFFTARVSILGQFESFADETRDGAIAQAQAFVNQFGGSIDWAGRPAYVLLDKKNVVALLKTWLTHESSAWAQSWIFIQGGVNATSSPRKTWSHGE